MEMTVKQYAAKKGIGKDYILRLCREYATKKHLLPDVLNVEQRTDSFGTKYYVLILKSNQK